jgi:uncharacterized membrane protein YphA (DoxX/SURF4 family)
MKKTKIIYWIFTALLGLSMLSTAIPEIINGPDAIKFMSALGFPPYINPFLGIAKILGVIAILVPRFPRIKEWAYAGFCFDLIGATYSQIAIGTPFNNWIFMLIFFIPLIGSYIYYHKKLKGV